METQFTLIFFEHGMYHANKDRLKEIIRRYGLIWNEGRRRSGISYELMIDIYRTFKIEDNIIEDKLLEGRGGSSGIWESSSNAIKIIVFDTVEGEHFPVLLVYKGDESSFYKEFILECIGIGCEISKVVEKEDGEFEQIFRKKKNIKMMMLLNDSFATRKIMEDNFLRRIKNMEKVGEISSVEFIDGWKNLINKWGTYTDKMLIDDFCNNMKDEIDKNEIEKGDKNNA
jgi:hypothetical protein